MHFGLVVAVLHKSLILKLDMNILYGNTYKSDF